MSHNESETVRLSKRVDPYHNGWLLLDFLCHRFRYLQRETWVERIDAGKLRVDGRPARADTIVNTDALVEYEIRVAEPDVDFTYEVVHEDRDILVVSKSGNIPVHAGGTYFRNTLIARLREERGPELALAHRLDRETSGLVVLTRTREAARAMASAFAEGRVDKTYLAVVHGEPADDEFAVDAPLSRARRGSTTEYPIARMVVDAVGGKPARTLFRVLGTASPAGPPQKTWSLVEAKPLTGRTNQVRVHLEFAGNPMVGDKIYGVPPDVLRESIENPDSERVLRHLVLPRHALHAWRIAFPHPSGGSPLALEASLPADLASLLERPR